MPSHKDLTGLEVHLPWNYAQETDPGAVGAGMTWFKKSVNQLVYRNDANNTWLPILTAATGSTLAPGSTWPQVLTAVSTVAAGGVVTLPNEKIIQTSGLILGSKDITIIGSGPLSEIQARNDISISGSAAQVMIDDTSGAQTKKITLKGFTLSQDRAYANRSTTIYIRGGLKEINIDSMRFNDCTANVIQIFPFNVANHTINITNCVATEWYEGFVEACRGSIYNLIITNNTGNTSSGNMGDLSASRPQVFLIANDSATTSTGIIHNLVIVGNRFYATANAAVTNSTGFTLHNGTNCPVLWENVWLSDNVFSGFWQNRIARYHFTGSPTPGGGEGRALIHMTKNKFYSSGSINPTTFEIVVSNSPVSHGNDRIFCSDNDFCKPSGPGNLVITDPTGAGTVQSATPPNKFYQYPFPAMSSDITESFIKADSDTLGPNLTWTEVAGDFDIVSNKAKLITLGSNSRARAETALASADHYVACVVNQSARAPLAGQYSRIGVIARWAADDTSFIVAYIDYRHRRVGLYTATPTGGSERPLGGTYVFGLGAGINVPVKLSLRCEGSLISVFLDNQPVLVETDTTVTTGNYTGIFGYDYTGSTLVLTYSAFEAGTV